MQRLLRGEEGIREHSDRTVLFTHLLLAIASTLVARDAPAQSVEYTAHATILHTGNSLSLILPELDSTDTALDSQRDALIADSATQNTARSTLNLGQFDNLSTLADREDQSRVEIVTGGTVNFQNGSLTMAQGGQVAVSAGQRHTLGGDEVSVLGALEHSAPHWTEAARDALMRDTLAAADEDCARLMGPDRAAWAWGRLHQLRFAHALGQILPEIGGRRLDVGPVPIGGSNTTVGLAEYRDTDFGIIFGASFRMVLDVGDWDRSLAINAPGQAGNPASRHYDDLTPLWAAGDCVPLLFSDEAVEAATVARIHLLPSDGFGRRT